MIDTYRITIPSPVRAKELGFKWEGQCNRTEVWLSGVVFALEATESNITFKVSRMSCSPTSSNHFVEFETDSIPLALSIVEVWKKYGFICQVVKGRRDGFDITDPILL